MAWIQHLSAPVQQHFFSMLQKVELLAGDTLYAPGDFAGKAYFLFSGRVQLGTTSANGKEVLFSLHGAGELVGEAAVVEGGRRMYRAVATENGEMGVISASDFNELRRLYPEFSDAVTSQLLLMIHNLVQKFNQTALWSLEKRLAFAVLRHHQAEDGRIMLSQEELGHMLGVTRQSVHRIVKQLHQSKLLVTRNRRLYVEDKVALREYFRSLD